MRSVHGDDVLARIDAALAMGVVSADPAVSVDAMLPVAPMSARE